MPQAQTIDYDAVANEVRTGKPVPAPAIQAPIDYDAIASQVRTGSAIQSTADQPFDISSDTDPRAIQARKEMTPAQLAVISAGTMGKKLGTGVKNLATGTIESLGALDEDPIGTLYNAAKSIAGAPTTLIDALQKFHEGRTTGDANKMAEGATKFITEAAPALLGLEGAIKPVRGALSRMSENSASAAADLATKKAIHPYAYTESVEPAAEAFGAKSGESRFIDFADNWDTGAKEIKQSGDKLFKNGIQDNRSQIIAGKDAMDRIYNTDIGPKVALVSEQDLTPLKARLKSQIPDSFSPREAAIIEKGIDEQLGQAMDGPTMEKTRQKFSAADRVAQAASNYAGAALYKTPRGWLYKNLDMGLRDYLAEQVNQVQPGTDIRPALKRYGAVTDITQQAGGIPVDKTTMELLTGKAYITGTTPNLTGRVIEAATKKWYANDNLIRRAYSKYTGPVARPQMPRTGVDTLSGTQSTIPLTNGWPVTSEQPYVGGPLFDNPIKSGIDQASGSLNRSLADRNMFTHISHNGELLTPEEYTAKFHGKPMPQYVDSTRINPNQLYGNTPTSQKALPAPPIRVPIMTDGVPKSVIQNMTLENAKRIPLEHGRSSNIFPAPNVQFSGEVTGNLNPELRGPGVMLPSDPAFIQDILSSYDKAIKATKVKAKLTELTTQRDAILRALRERGKK